jgi:hypothetical protein
MLGSVVGLPGSGLLALALGWVFVLAVRATDSPFAAEDSLDPGARRIPD